MPLPTPFKLISAADSKSGATPRVLYTVPAGKQASIKTVNAANMLTVANQVTLSLSKAGVVTRLSAPSLAVGAASNLLTGTLNMGPGDSLVQTSASNRLNLGNSILQVDPRLGAQLIYDLIRANGIYVAIGQATGADPYNNLVYTSTDAVAWTWRDPAPTATDAKLARAIAYGAGLFVIVGSAGFISTSPDGINWTIRSPAVALASTDITSVIYAGGRFVAAGTGATGAAIQTSSDGISWTARTVPTSLVSPQLTYEPTLALYAVSTGGSAANGVHTSPDGTTWTQRGTMGSSGVQAFSGKLYATTNTTTMWSSSDGVNWSGFQSANAGNLLGGLRVMNGRLVQTDSTYVASTTDGYTWEFLYKSDATAIAVLHDGAGYLFIRPISLTTNPPIYRVPDIGYSVSESASFVASIIEVNL